MADLDEVKEARIIMPVSLRNPRLFSKGFQFPGLGIKNRLARILIRNQAGQ